MIRLTRPPIPAALKKAAPQALALLEEARQKGLPLAVKSSVYNHPSVKKALRRAQHDKCAYCETRQPRSHDVVEHYRPVKGWQQVPKGPLHGQEYFWLAYDWDNLLFACDLCNDQNHKGNYFPLANPQSRATAADRNIEREEPLLLNPYGNRDPEEHIGWRRDMPFALKDSPSGKATIDTFGLDKDASLLTERRNHFNEIEEWLICAEQCKRRGLHDLFTATKANLDDRVSMGKWEGMIRANLKPRIDAL